MTLKKNVRPDPVWFNIRIDSWLPRQHDTRLSLLKNADTYLLRGVKFEGIAFLHSYPELLYFALAHADPLVTTIIPQPFQLRRGRERYTPDFFVLSGGRRLVVEIKANKDLDDDRWEIYAAYFAANDHTFCVVSNELMIEQESIARRYLPIIQSVAFGNYHAINTQAQEMNLRNFLWKNDHVLVGEILDQGARESQQLRELALYRMIVSHRLSVDLTHQDLGFESELTPCF